MSDSDKGMVPTAKSLEVYLGLKDSQMFCVPSFQRAYTWGVPQCEKLLDDLFSYHNNNQNESNDPYFFGNVITVDVKSEKNQTMVQLIDGQQRTTTFLVLLKALHFLLNDYKQIEDDLNKVSVRMVDKWLEKILCILYKIDTYSIANYELKNFTDFFEKKGEIDFNRYLILSSESMNELDYAITDWNNLIKCSKFTDFNPQSIPNKRKDNKYTNFYKNIRYFYNNIKDRLHNFDKNSSVKQIEYLTFFIQTLLEKCKLIQIASDNINQAVAVFNSLNATGLPLSDADVICSSAYSNCDDSSAKKNFQDKWHELISNVENKLTGYFSLNDILQQFMYYQRFKEDRKTDVRTPGLRYYYMTEKRTYVENPIEFCNNLNLVTNIWINLVSNYPIIRLVLNINNNIHFFLSTYFYHLIINEKKKVRNIDSNTYNFDYYSDIEQISELFLRLFTVLELVDYSYSSKKFKVFLFEMGDKFVKLNDEVSFEEIKQDFNNNIFDIIKESIKDLKTELLEYRGDKLVYLNEYLYCKEYNKGFYFDIDPNRINIEHILPQSMHNVLDPVRNLSEEEYDDLIEKIGNKILLERNINNNVSDDNFKIKKTSSIKGKLGYKDSCYAIASDLCDYQRDGKDIWVSEDIDNATENAVNRIVNFLIEPLDESKKNQLKI